ncbi:hypothetical protein NKJ90_12040 [Mesorhizobium sp. M0051]|nr:hypothetical protein [Mesorhizobium sp. LNHC252B00]
MKVIRPMPTMARTETAMAPAVTPNVVAIAGSSMRAIAMPAGYELM